MKCWLHVLYVQASLSENELGFPVLSRPLAFEGRTLNPMLYFIFPFPPGNFIKDRKEGRGTLFMMSRQRKYIAEYVSNQPK